MRQASMDIQLLPCIYAPVPSPLAAPPTPVASPPKYVPEKRQIAVQGVVYCKSCKYTAYNTLMEATALPVVLTAVTDKKGYFFIAPSKKVSHLGAQKRCKVFLVSPPKKSKVKSMIPTNMYGGLIGAYLMPQYP
ncbi:hypothetical protein MKW94_025109 [Papaver nudicaule]|uniref:Pollen Ole e 1 allergen and extensin family protein n=1 Tax=Papaver nudicaule TaxID=74823 RepID=A0AA41V4I3_PAPNU|nr:hypothetical protein [Papaver nudicaule]